uniref:SH2 domain-containing protein 7-like n=1 Tax=Pristiophorus japonicus TaxID=55135 RepID=UPI00398E4A01
MGEPQRLLTSARQPPANSDTMVAGMLKEMTLRWFTETQAALILQNGRLPEWFHGMVTRKAAENVLKDRGIGHFLIRLSDRAIGYILSYKGTDRCRHFVIQQLKTGKYKIDGSTHTHQSLAALLDYYTMELIQPFGEVLTESCTQYNSNNLYDHISINPPNSSRPGEAENKDIAARRPGPRSNSDSEEGPRRPPAVPPKTNRMLRRSNLSLESMSSSEDSDSAPHLPSRTCLAFEEENQEGAKYGRVNKLKAMEKPVPAMPNEEHPARERLTNPLLGAGMDTRKAQPSERTPQPLPESSTAIYSLAAKPQPIYSEAFERKMNADVVYTEVDLKQLGIGAIPSPAESSYATISVPEPMSQIKHLTMATPPSTPPRLSPNLNNRMKPSPPADPAQKQGSGQRFVPGSRPLPQPLEVQERVPAKEALFEASLGMKSSTKAPENMYEQIPDGFSKRYQAKPASVDKDEIRKKWFSDWKCK